MWRFLFLFLAAVSLGACTEEGKYPVSGEECSEGDPVQDIVPPDCATLPSGSGTF